MRSTWEKTSEEKRQQVIGQAYIDQNRLETDVVVAAHQDESDDGES